MKKLNPFSGPGSLQAERQQRRREQFKVVVWAVLGANLVLFVGMLIQGCRGEPAPTETPSGSPAEVSAADTNGTAVANQKPEADSPVPPSFEPVPTSPETVTNTVAETATNRASTPAPVAAKQYAVLKGDSFYKVARANGVSLKALTEANPGIDSTKLKVGQVLQLPVGAEPGTTISASAPAAADGTGSQPTASSSKAQSRYVVKSGDSLGQIARTHRTTVQAIKAANGLTSDRIVAGQNLKLPESRTVGTSSARG
ncbi:MAG: LysM peptidoglycan-binding domain-containing protein [Limisphaerales bacterium]